MQFSCLSPVTSASHIRQITPAESSRVRIISISERSVKWSGKWQMLLNFGKGKCLHTGHGNLDVNYEMGDTVLGTTVKEKDLGVTISPDMKIS